MERELDVGGSLPPLSITWAYTFYTSLFDMIIKEKLGMWLPMLLIPGLVMVVMYLIYNLDVMWDIAKVAAGKARAAGVPGVRAAVGGAARDLARFPRVIAAQLAAEFAPGGGVHGGFTAVAEALATYPAAISSSCGGLLQHAEERFGAAQGKAGPLRAAARVALDLAEDLLHFPWAVWDALGAVVAAIEPVEGMLSELFFGAQPLEMKKLPRRGKGAGKVGGGGGGEPSLEAGGGGARPGAGMGRGGAMTGGGAGPGSGAGGSVPMPPLRGAGPGGAPPVSPGGGKRASGKERDRGGGEKRAPREPTGREGGAGGGGERGEGAPGELVAPPPPGEHPPERARAV